jgi:hypothetical protein
MAFVRVERSDGMPRDDMLEEFVREYFQRVDARKGSEVQEYDEAFALKLELPQSCVTAPEVYVVSDTSPEDAGTQAVVAVVIRAGAFEWWTLLPSAVRLDGIRAEHDGGIVWVTLPKALR